MVSTKQSVPSKPISRKKDLAMAFVVTCSLIAAPYFAYEAWNLTRGWKVTVANRAGYTIDNVRMHFSGGPTTLGDIPDSSDAEVRIAVLSETSIDLEFTDRTGMERSVKLDVYLLPEDRGAIRVEVGDDKSVLVLTGPVNHTKTISY